MAVKLRAVSFVILLFAAMKVAQADSLPDDTPLSNLGEAVLHIKTDVLILPNATRVVFKNGKIVAGYAVRSFPMCSIEMRQAERKTRILRADARDIQLTGETGNDVCHGGGCWIHLMASADDETVQSILCANSIDNGQTITLKVLLDAFGRYLSVETPPPAHGSFGQ